MKEENLSKTFIRGHIYVIDEDLFIDKEYKGDIQAYKEDTDNLLWIKDVMGLEFTVSDEGDGYMHSRRVVGRSGIPWLVSRAWCRDVTNQNKENKNQGGNETMIDREIVEVKEKTLVVFEGCDGEEYKVPICSSANLETMNKLGCGSVNCLGIEKLGCDNCIFDEGRSVNKDQLKFERGGLGLAFNKEAGEPNKETNKEENKTKLSQTTELMNSADYKGRFKAEYLQLKIRMDSLRIMLDKYKAGTLSFEPSCSYDLLNGQYKAMILYASYLEERAKIENIDLEDI